MYRTDLPPLTSSVYISWFSIYNSFWWLEEVNSDWENHSDSTSSFHLSFIERWAIINASDLHEKFQHLFTLKNCCSTHHRGLVRFRISDRKFVNHTTEMILWSMILTSPCLACLSNQSRISTYIGKQKVRSEKVANSNPVKCQIQGLHGYLFSFLMIGS